MLLRLLEWSIANCLLVLLLAPIVFLVGRLSRQPSVRHALWILLLVKLLTPPLVPVSLEHAVRQLPVALMVDARSSKSSQSRMVATVSNKAAEHQAASDSPRPGTALVPIANESRASSIGIPSIAPLMVFLARSLNWLRDLPWSRFGPWLLMIWGAGSLLMFIGQAGRMVAFARRVRRATRPSLALSNELQDLREALGRTQTPKALLIDGMVSPMLWGLGPRATILFPRELFHQLHPEARATLLLHELAHFYRGDHWVRLLQFATLVLFWWHPVVWWSLFEIEAAEEYCCDHWVLERSAASPKCYANALLDTIDFLCEKQGWMPPIVTGLGNPRELRGRLVCIMRHQDVATINGFGRLIVLGVALLLPVQPQSMAAVSSEFRSIFERSSLEPPTPQTSARVQQQEPPPPAPALKPRRTSPPRTIQQPAAPVGQTRESSPENWATATSADGRFSIVAFPGQRVELRDHDRGSTTDLQGSNISSVAFIAGRPWFVSGGFDRHVRLWDAASAVVLWDFGEHADAIVTVAATRDGSTVAAGLRDGTAVVYELETLELIVEWQLGSPITCLRFAPDGNRLVATTGRWRSEAAGMLFVLDKRIREMSSLKLVSTKPAGVLEFSDDPDVVVLGNWDGTATYVSLADGVTLTEVAASKNQIAAAAFSANAGRFAPMTWFEALAEQLRQERLAAERAASERVYWSQFGVPPATVLEE